MYYLWYDNGSGHFDCVSVHETLTEAIAAAGLGWRTCQHITGGAGAPIVWKNY